MASNRHGYFVDIVSDIMIGRLNDDRTLETFTIAIASYWKLCGYSLSECFEMVQSGNFVEKFWKLMRCRSKFYDFGVQNVGTAIVEFIIGSSLQTSLNVKHIKSSDENEVQFNSNINVPIINKTILHSHSSKIWIRFYVPMECEKMKLMFLSGPFSNGGNVAASTTADPPPKHKLRNLKFFDLGDNIYEVAFFKSTKKICTHEYRNSRRVKLSTLEFVQDITVACKLIEHFGGDVIFCSELGTFRYNRLLFISNFIVFHYIYFRQHKTFQIYGYDDLKVVFFLALISFSYLKTNNLTISPDSTHGPLIKYTGDAPKRGLYSCKLNRVYNNTGTRAAISTDMYPDANTNSNFMEIVAQIQLKHDTFDKIL